MKRILITGHRGFVGRAFLRHLMPQNVEIHGVDIVEGNDIRDFVKVNDIHYDLVIHLAAIVGGRRTIEGNPLSVAADLAIDADVIQWALRTRPEHFVYFSSSAAYPTHLQKGWHQNLRLPERCIDWSDEDEDTIPMVPDMTYGWAKLTGEYLCEFLAAEAVRTHIFRPFSGYGADQDPSYPFPAFIQRAVLREDPFKIWGDGNQVRDFIHIDDIVAAVFAAIEADVKGPVNLCSGMPTSFNQLASFVTAGAGYNPTFQHVMDAPVGVQYRVGDPTKMLSFYEPRISLEEGVTAALTSHSLAGH